MSEQARPILCPVSVGLPLNQNCQRCGALLPDGHHEGLCPACGNPAGDRAAAKAALLADLEAAHRLTLAARKSAASAPSAAAAPRSETQASVPLALIVGAALILAALILAVATLLMLPL